jgi:uncharacterized phage protein gp47/JayE
MPYNRPSLTEISTRLKSQLAQELKTPLPFQRASILSALSNSLAGALHLIYAQIDEVRKQLFIDSATGSHLDRLALHFGVKRRIQTKSIGVVKLTGAEGLVVPKGAILTCPGGNPYETLEASTIDDSGSVFTKIESQQLGPAYNLPQDTEMILIESIASIDQIAVVQSPGLIEGFAQETDEELRARVNFIVRHTGQGGSRVDYERWAKEIPGVGHVEVLDSEERDFLVRVRFQTTEKTPPPSEALIARVQELLNKRKPLGTRVIVLPIEADNA